MKSRRLFSYFISLVSCYKPSLFERDWLIRHRKDICQLDNQSIRHVDQLFHALQSLDSKVHSQILNIISRQILNREKVQSLLQQSVAIAEQSHEKFIPFYAEIFPSQLLDLEFPPVGIYCRGSTEHLNQTCVGVVGSRKATLKAKAISFSLGKAFADNDISTVSGGALGCDIMAHKGVLDAQKFPCPAIVVFAGGLGQLYPRYNASVFRTLLQKKALFVSERPPMYRARAFDFPHRNRIISAFGRELVVVQCTVKSGAMNSASHARAMGRDVFVYRQKDDVNADGCELLISDGISYFESLQEYL